MGLTEPNLSDRDQGQADVPDPAEHAMQRGLVCDEDSEERGAVGLRQDGQSLEPPGQLGSEVAREPELVH